MKLGIYVDINNLFHRVGKEYPQRKVDYRKLLGKITDSFVGAEVHKALAYGFYAENEAAGFITCLKEIGFIPRYRRYKHIKGAKKFPSWNVGLAMDVIRDLDVVDQVVICSSDRELIELTRFLQSEKVPTMMLGCGISDTLKGSVDAVIEIGPDLLIS